MSGLHGATKLSAMKASFPPAPYKIEGKPSLKSLLRILKHMMECAKKHRTDGQPLGKLYLCVPPALYALQTAIAYPTRAADPGDSPFYAAGSTATQRKQCDNQFANLYRKYHGRGPHRTILQLL